MAERFIPRLLEDVLAEHPDFKPGWAADRHGGMANPRYGEVRHIVACRPDGTPVYDTFDIKESPAVIIVPYAFRDDGIVEVCLCDEYRFVTQKNYLSLPMGFIDLNEDLLEGAKRELFEEAGIGDDQIIGVTDLGNNNANIVCFRSVDLIFAVQCNGLSKKDGKFGTDTELIEGVKLYTFTDLRTLQKGGKLVNSLTRSALFAFGCEVPEFYRT